MDCARRSGRIAKEVDILLLGTDTTGKVFSEETKTVVLSRHGAGIVSRHHFDTDEILTLRLKGSSKEAEIRLVGQFGGEPNRYVYGVAFVDPKLDFWQIEFPPADAFQPGSRSLALECSLCHERQEIQPRDIEADVYSVNQSILRHCPRCGTATAWKQAESDVSSLRTPEPRLKPSEHDVSTTAVVQYPPVLSTALVERAEPIKVPALVMASKPIAAPSGAPEKSAEPVTGPATPARRVNRRRHVRTRVSFLACVRQAVSGDDIVECENVSKGGVSFRSLKRYDEGSLIEVAVPYSPGSPAIFVQARIQHVEELPGGRLFRHGAEYTNSSSAQ